MWVYSEKQKTWVNLEQVQRIASDGQGGYLLISQDGKKTSIDQTWYDKAMRWVDPDWWEKHPNGGKDSLNFEDALKAIMKATGAKMDKRIMIRKRGKNRPSPFFKIQTSFFASPIIFITYSTTFSFALFIFVKSF